MKKNSVLLWIGILCFFFSIAYAAPLARIDRNKISEGETFNLIFDMTTVPEGVQPDLSGLENNFTIIGSSVNDFMSVINGVTSRKREWIVQLAPKKTGSITIPSLPVGKQSTDPITLTVMSANQLFKEGRAPKVFVKNDLSSSTLYPGAQAIYTTQLYYSVPIANANIAPPQIADANVMQINNDTAYTTAQGDRQYQVLERHYAIIPKNSGHFVIGSPILAGDVIDQNNTNQNGFRLYTSMPKPIRVSGNDLTIDVKPIPAAFKNKEWLPLNSLQLSDKWSDETSFRVGEPVTRTITLKALGMTGDSIPALSLSSIDDVKTYPDKPEVSTDVQNNWLLGTRVEKYAFIPMKAGKITLPAIRLSWWDTKNNRAEIAEIPEKTITVLPSANGNEKANFVSPVAAHSQSTTSTPANTAISSNAQVNLSQPEKKSSLVYVILFSGVFILFLLTSLFFWMRRKKNVIASNTISSENESLKKIIQRIQQACDEKNPKQIEMALIAWAKIMWPNETITSLGAVIKHAPSEMKPHLQQLDSTRYSAGKNLDCDLFWENIQAFLKNNPKKSEKKEADLPHLYL